MPWVCAPSTSNGYGLDSAGSCALSSASSPTCGPFPWVITSSCAAASGASARTAAVTCPSWISDSGSSPRSRSALPPRAATILIADCGRAGPWLPPSPSCWVTLDRAGHAPRPAPAPAKFAARDGDDLDAVLAQHRVGGDVALVPDDHPWRYRQVVGAVVPLLPLGGAAVLIGGQHPDRVQAEDLRDRGPQVTIPGYPR